MKKFLLSLLTGCLFSGISTASPPLIAEYKLETAHRVFERLILARGDFGLPKPKLELLSNPKELARFSGQTVYLGEKAYDLCASFGADSLNALAALLSHELIHYYAGHTWEDEFSREFATADLREDVKDSWLEDEVQADLWGGLLAFSAGYNVQAVVPVFLPKLYQSFGKEEDLAGYPHLSERIQLAKQSGEKLDELLRYFETANYLVAIGMYEDALGYYQAILKEGYRGREMYNNIGVYYVQAALGLFRKTDIPYGLPLELDVQARIGPNTKGNTLGNKEQREQFLQEAIRYFESARSMDPEYTTALINLGCAHILLGVSTRIDDPDQGDLHFSQAQIMAKKAERETGNRRKQNTDVLVLRGLLAALQEDTPSARRYWESASSPLALANVQVLEKGAFGVSGERLPRANERERIEDYSLDLFLRQPLFDTQSGLEASFGKFQWGKCRAKASLSNSNIYLHSVGPGRYALLQATDPGYSGSSLLGIRLGSKREDVISAYKTPDAVVQLGNGEFLVYPAREILFRLDEQQQVTGWCVFRAVKP
ncbi:MAG: hypothetical protein IPH04_09860 [Saprospirales bacterium]|nr:hypothetical protein [Saprospirales bacterium]MBK7334640.1 hypothetical protein [Saprospirales bacterium]